MIVGFTEIDSSKERWDDYVKDLILASNVEPSPFDISMLIFKTASYFSTFSTQLRLVFEHNMPLIAGLFNLFLCFPRKQARCI